jgi:hypothetical protein
MRSSSSQLWTRRRYQVGSLGRWVAGSLLLLCDTASAEALHVPANLYVAIRLSEDMPVGATLSWRIDEQPIHYQYMPELRSTFMSALHALSPDALKRTNRKRKRALCVQR